jgi:hypothetical protein
MVMYLDPISRVWYDRAPSDLAQQSASDVTSAVAAEQSRAMAAEANAVTLAAGDARYETAHVAKAGDSLQALIDAAGAGDKIVVPAGVTLAAAATVNWNKKLSITGPGRVNWTAGIANAPALHLTNADGSRLDGLELGNPNLLGDPTQGSGVSHAIFIEANNVVVTRCLVDSFLHGITVAATGEWSNNVISFNRVKDILGGGGGPSSASANGEDRGDGITVWGSQATIIGNIVNCKAGSDARIGIHTEALSTYEGTQNPPHPDAMVTITGNVVYGQFRRGIVTEQVENVAITGNSVADPTWWGITTGRASGATVTGNTIMWTRKSTDNQGSAFAPIRAALTQYGGTTAGTAQVGNVFAANTVRMTNGSAADSCVAVTGGGGTDMPQDCIIEANTFINEGCAIKTGIDLGIGSKNITVRNNKLLGGYTQYGIYGYGTIHPLIVGNEIVGSGVAATTAGIHLESETTQSVTVSGNRISGCGIGVDLTNNTVGGVVADNEITTATTGVSGYGMTNLHVRHTLFIGVTTPYAYLVDGTSGNTVAP